MRIVSTDVNAARTPKLSGLNSLVNTGVTATISPCETRAPPATNNTERTNPVFNLE
ncbi:hypothetical protein D3C76_503610 [compost metagenome]